MIIKEAWSQKDLLDLNSCSLNASFWQLLPGTSDFCKESIRMHIHYSGGPEDENKSMCEVSSLAHSRFSVQVNCSSSAV